MHLQRNYNPLVLLVLILLLEIYSQEYYISLGVDV